MGEEEEGGWGRGRCFSLENRITDLEDETEELEDEEEEDEEEEDEEERHKEDPEEFDPALSRLFTKGDEGEIA